MQYCSLEKQYFMWMWILIKGEHNAGVKGHELCPPLATSCKCNGRGDKGQVPYPGRRKRHSTIGQHPHRASQSPAGQTGVLPYDPFLTPPTSRKCLILNLQATFWPQIHAGISGSLQSQD